MRSPRESAVRRRDWQLSKRALETFLASLDRDRNAAAERYEHIRARLLRFFEWRGCEFPEECADETITRVIRKIDEGATLQDPASYCYGVARLVLLEALKTREKERQALAQIQPLSVYVDDVQRDVEERLECLRSCMKRLPADQQTLIAEYHRHDPESRIEGRKRLAASLGIGLNALRIRAHRLSATLGSCVGHCLEQEERP
jgi:DNA-directed RNA polymerase specialized sigma24 family protein